MTKRSIEIVVLSDLHLGAYACRATELLTYLQGIMPETLILNGDIIDIWQFKKSYFPTEHHRVIQEILRMTLQGTKVYYITGNHDDALRRFTDFSTGTISLRNQLELVLKGKKYGFFHGDVFDASVMVSPWLAKIGGKGYDWLIRLNRFINQFLRKMGRSELSFAHFIKKNVKKAVKYIQDFEDLAIGFGVQNEYDYVVCGHIHRPLIQSHIKRGRTITYMNSGDWVENCSALEFYGGVWHLYYYDPLDIEIIEVALAEKKENNPSSLGKEKIAKGSKNPKVTAP